MAELLKRWIARACYARGPRCFYCGAARPTPCPGHESGGTITGFRVRRWAPWWIAGPVNPYWSLPARAKPHP